MRDTPLQNIERFRLSDGQSKQGDLFGLFDWHGLHIISSGTLDGQWEHVSVSRSGRTPSWEEMCKVKNIFWGPEEVVIQFHPAESEYVNCHPHCLHLWRSMKHAFPMPPPHLVGPK